MAHKQDLSAEDVIRLMQTPPENARNFKLGVGKNLIVLKKLEISSQTYQTSWLHFENCEFTQDVEIADINFAAGVSFTNCTFRKSIHFSNIGFISDTRSEINLTRCTIERICDFRNCTFKHGGINIIECEIKTCCNFVSNRINHGGIKILKSTIFNIHDFAFNRLSASIEIHYTTISENIRLEANNVGSIHISHSTFSQTFWIALGRCNTGISISDSNFYDKFTLDTIRFSKYYGVTFVANKFQRGAMIKYDARLDGNRRFYVGPRSIYLEANAFQSKFECIKVQDDTLNFKSQIDVRNLDLIFSDQQKGELEFSNINFHKVNISGVNTSSSNSFYQSTIRRLEFNKVINKGTINFIELTPKLRNQERFQSQIGIYSSHLGDSRFMTTYFNEYDKLVLSESDLSFITISPFNWFSQEKSRRALRNGENATPRYIFWKYLLSSEQLENELEYAHLAKELQRQLKIIADRMGERTYAHSFKSFELQLLYRELQLSTSLFNKERILLAFNSVNDFGTNWVKPLIYLLVSTAILYIPIEVASREEIYFRFTIETEAIAKSTQALFRNSHIFWELLNPTHNLSNLYNHQIVNNWAYPFDYLQRTLLAVFAFQTISAFRKYSK